VGARPDAPRRQLRRIRADRRHRLTPHAAPRGAPPARLQDGDDGRWDLALRDFDEDAAA
jgi:hypothetical protein